MRRPSEGHARAYERSAAAKRAPGRRVAEWGGARANLPLQRYAKRLHYIWLAGPQLYAGAPQLPCR
jgi:hypothetical protein